MTIPSLQRIIPLLAAALVAACEAPEPPALDLPPRSEDAVEADELVAQLTGLSLEERESRILAEIRKGNVPGWLRTFQEVRVRSSAASGEHEVVFWALPDYLAVGSDTSFVFTPLSYSAAQQIVREMGGMLPTVPMVDAIWRAARARLSPVRLPPDDEMRSVPYFERHNRLVLAQRFLYDVTPGEFAAGGKVDLVSMPAAATEPAMAIYGWHRRDGRPIQPLFIRDTDRIVSFNQGVRVVASEVLIDGQRRDIAEVWDDPATADLLLGPATVPPLY